VIKLIFAVLYVSLNDGPLHFVIKRKFFTFIFAVFQSQSIAEILPLPHLENKGTPYENSTSSFEFELFIITGM